MTQAAQNVGRTRLVGDRATGNLDAIGSSLFRRLRTRHLYEPMDDSPPAQAGLGW
jgi:hypothetical protein